MASFRFQVAHWMDAGASQEPAQLSVKSDAVTTSTFGVSSEAKVLPVTEERWLIDGREFVRDGCETLAFGIVLRPLATTLSSHTLRATLTRPTVEAIPWYCRRVAHPHRGRTRVDLFLDPNEPHRIIRTKKHFKHH